MATPEELAYLAGVIDSDGWISVCRESRANKGWRECFRVALGIKQKEDAAVALAHALFGGYRGLGRTGNDVGMHGWTVSGKVAVLVLDQLLPHLRIKRHKAVLILEYRDVIGNGPRGRYADKTTHWLKMKELWARMAPYTSLKGAMHRKAVVPYAT